MKPNQLLLLLLLSLSSLCSAQTDSLPVANQETIWMVTEQMPTYPGGRPAWEKYLRENLRYPAEAQTEQVQGTVYVAFIIRPDGSVDNPQVVKGIGHGCDEEALRLVREMPNWIPGKQGGQPVSVRYSLPVSFFLRP